MKNLLLFLSLTTAFFLTNCNKGTLSKKGIPLLQYKLTWCQSPGKLQVDLIYTPVESGSTVFKYGDPKFGGQLNILDGLKNFHVDAPHSFRLDEGARAFTIYHPQNKPVHITYSIVDTHTPSQGPLGQLFRPIITEKELFIHSLNLFLEPLFKNNKEVLQSVTWVNFPKNMRLFQSFDPENRGDKVSTATLDKFINGGFKTSVITAATDLKIQSSMVDNIPLYSILKEGHSLNSGEFQSYLPKYIASARRFWNSYVDPYYFIALLPFLPPFNTPAGSIGGMALQNGHFSKYGSENEPLSSIIKHCSHEILHNWIVIKIHMKMEDMWFNEGFTDYISWYIMAQQGILTSETFAENLNEDVLKPHYSSTNKNISNREIAANFWNLGDDNKLPYRRGSLYAFYLDNQIRLKSDNKKNIRDLLLNIQEFDNHQSENYELKAEDFIRLTSNFLPEKQVKEDFNKYIINGDPIMFSSNNLVDLFRVSYQNDIPKIQIIKELANFYHY